MDFSMMPALRRHRESTPTRNISCFHAKPAENLTKTDLSQSVGRVFQRSPLGGNRERMLLAREPSLVYDSLLMGPSLDASDLFLPRKVPCQFTNQLQIFPSDFIWYSRLSCNMPACPLPRFCPKRGFSRPSRTKGLPLPKASRTCIHPRSLCGLSCRRYCSKANSVPAWQPSRAWLSCGWLWARNHARTIPALTAVLVPSCLWSSCSD